ncbi:hypothetical protein E2C01_094837 [Portunus trituberculatus]|uniref:Uncharacterized protein n=1 Tax=Portunus trituberculatus TaxID=210409 RepID=A0A5B7K483_PORTR|nr:hypothetical protein [Portunus trituberculatus]
MKGEVVVVSRSFKVIGGINTRRATVCTIPPRCYGAGTAAEGRGRRRDYRRKVGRER